jgi:hypothetical protein
LTTHFVSRIYKFGIVKAIIHKCQAVYKGLDKFITNIHLQPFINLMNKWEGRKRKKGQATFLNN